MSEKFKELKKFQSILKANKLTIKKGFLEKKPYFKFPKKTVIVTLCVAGLISYNLITAYLNNQQVPTNNNFSPDQVIDNPNDNDITFDDNGQIIIDPISPEEKLFIVNKFKLELLKDIQNRVSEPILNIDKIISINQLPYNSCEDDNEFDKYQISILFQSKDKTYCLNYLTGEEFEYNEGDRKNTLLDFSDHLSNSSLDLCYSMGESEKAILNLLGKDFNFVSPSYLAYGSSGDLFYYIPVFGNKDNKPFVKLYSCMSNVIDAYNYNPSELLISQLNGGEAYFTENHIQCNENYNSVLKLYNDFNYNQPQKINNKTTQFYQEF